MPSTRQWAGWLRAGGTFGLSVLLAYFLNIGLTYLSESSLSGTPNPLAKSVFALPLNYQRFVTTWGHSELIPGSVSLVVITEENEPRFVDGCEQRRLLAGIVNALNDSRAKVIVLDKVFRSDLDCVEPGTQRDPTNELQNAVWNTSKTKQMVIGLAAEDDHIADSLAFRNGGHLSWGLAQRAKDYREVPLVWNVYPDKQHGTNEKPKAFRSLPYAAALAKQPINFQSDTIHQALVSGIRPLTVFTPANTPNGSDMRKLAVFSAGRVICGQDVLPHLADLDSCIQRARYSKFDRSFVTDVVVVGQASGKVVDVHATAIGPVAGVVLVANYIDSILSPDRLFRSPWPGGNIAFGLAFYGCFLWIMDKEKVWWIKVLAFLVLAVITFTLIIIIFAVWRLFFEPLTIGLVSIIVSYFRPLYDRWIERSRQELQRKAAL